MKDRVLVVEDDDDVLELIAGVLRDRGFTVHTARGGEDALKRLGEVVVDVILLDFTLPDMTGAEFLAIRRRVPEMSEIPVMILSGSDDACVFAEQRGLPKLRKPFGAAQLVSLLTATDQLPDHRSTPSTIPNHREPPRSR